MGGNAKTKLYLKECMADALIQLLKEKPLEQITVPEITNLAEVGRATYFRHFSKKEDLVTFKLIRLLERWKEENVQLNNFRDDRDRVYAYFSFHAGITELLELIHERGLLFTVYYSFFQTMVPEADSKERAYEIHFFASGVLGMVDEWVGNGFRESPEELTDMVCQFGRLGDGQTARTDNGHI